MRAFRPRTAALLAGLLLLRMWPCGSVAANEGIARPQTGEQRQRSECFAAFVEGRAPALLRLVRLRSEPERWVLHRQRRFGALALDVHEVEELAPGWRRVVRREIGPKLAHTRLTEFKVSTLLEAALALEERRGTPIVRPAPFDPRGQVGTQSGEFSGQGRTRYSGAVKRGERRFDVSGLTLGPLEALERSRFAPCTSRTFAWVAPETGLPEPIEERQVRLPSLGGWLRLHAFVDLEGEVRCAALFAGTELLALESGGRWFQRIDPQHYAALAGEVPDPLR